MTPEVRRALADKRSKVSHIIKYEMGVRGYTAKALALELGCSCNNVCKTIVGQCHSALVLDGLKRIGIPEEFLFDPRDVAILKKETKTRRVHA